MVAHQVARWELDGVGGAVIAALGRDAAPLKIDVRRLNELGLTISHNPGDELSPRGRDVLAHLRAGEAPG